MWSASGCVASMTLRRLTPRLLSATAMAPSLPAGPPSIVPAQEPSLMTMPSPWPTSTKLIVTLAPLVLVAVCVTLGFDALLGLWLGFAALAGLVGLADGDGERPGGVLDEEGPVEVGADEQPPASTAASAAVSKRTCSPRRIGMASPQRLSHPALYIGEPSAGHD